MFSTLAQLAAKYKLLILIVWLAAAALLFVFAPTLAKVGVTDDSKFLPSDAESTQATNLLNTRFASPVRESAGSATLVIYNPAGLNAQNQKDIAQLTEWLSSKEAPPALSKVVSASANPALQSSLVSQDGTTQAIGLELSAASSSSQARDAIKAIRDYVHSQHFSSQIFLSGNAGINYDLLTSVQNTIDKATLVTVLLVFVLLLLIYRSPVAILVPLLTIGMSYLVSRGVAGYIAASGLNVSSLADAYLVVTLFGIGTDYCLFMVSRFKEEVRRQGVGEAGQATLRRIGPVILASATTVMVALLCLGISQFGMNRTSGLILAMGVAVTLVAGLTLTPALIYLFGRNLLWPTKIASVQKTTGRGVWERIGVAITHRPLVFALPLIVVLALPYLALPGLKTTANVLVQMPSSTESVQGYNALRDHFPPGQLGPVYILLQTAPGQAAQAATLQTTLQLGQELSQLSGVASVDFPGAATAQVRSLADGARSAVQAASSGNPLALTYFQSLATSLQKLAVAYPAILQSPNFQTATDSLAQLSTLASQLQAGDTSVLTSLVETAGKISDALDGLVGEFALSISTPFSESLKQAYFSTDLSLIKMTLLLKYEPYSSQATSTLADIRAALRAAQPGFSQIERSYIGGTTAIQADVISVNDSDFLRVLLLAVVGILIVTFILIRSLVAPVYMILTVLFNFGATLGLSTWIFLDLLKQNSVIYMLPVFVYVMLVAVGSDYNIFLVSRIREENRSQPLREAICSAISNTGGVITSCGIILAGTFATLTTAPLQLVFQVGAAIGLGVLIDTFLVRAILIPTLSALVGKWNWWPFRN
jgi:RND superfamily putative drug exporter